MVSEFGWVACADWIELRYTLFLGVPLVFASLKLALFFPIPFLSPTKYKYSRNIHIIPKSIYLIYTQLQY